MATEVTVTFVLNEEVTPFLFAEKVANGVFRSGVLREGEAVLYEGTMWLRTEDVEVDLGGPGPIMTPGNTMLPATDLGVARAWMEKYQERKIP